MRNGDGDGKRERRRNQHHFDRFNSPYPLRHSSNSLSLRKLFLQFRQSIHTLLLVCPFPVCVWSPTLDDMSQDGLGCKWQKPHSSWLQLKYACTGPQDWKPKGKASLMGLPVPSGADFSVLGTLLSGFAPIQQGQNGHQHPGSHSANSPAPTYKLPFPWPLQPCPLLNQSPEVGTLSSKPGSQEQEVISPKESEGPVARWREQRLGEQTQKGCPPGLYPASRLSLVLAVWPRTSHVPSWFSISSFGRWRWYPKSEKCLRGLNKLQCTKGLLQCLAHLGIKFLPPLPCSGHPTPRQERPVFGTMVLLKHWAIDLITCFSPRRHLYACELFHRTFFYESLQGLWSSKWNFPEIGDRSDDSFNTGSLNPVRTWSMQHGTQQRRQTQALPS